MGIGPHPPTKAVSLVLLATALAGCGSGHGKADVTTSTASTSTAPPATSSHLFAPFNGGSVAAGVKVTKTARGYCWVGSLSDSRPDAWRCFLGNSILDPCFSNEANISAFVLCAESPWSNMTKLKLTKSLPRSQANPETAEPNARRPWAIELVDHKRCVAVSGATGAIAGLGLDYECTGGGVLAGAPRRRNPSWTIFYASSFKAKTLSEQHIALAWW